MTELIKISNSNDNLPTVSARDLYHFLELSPTQWKRWYNKNIAQNEFMERNRDYWEFDIMSKTLHDNGLGGRPSKDFQLTLNSAKKICMKANTAKGEEARNYFLAKEKEAESKKLFDPKSITKIDLAHMLIESEEERLFLKSENDSLKPLAEATVNIKESNSLVCVGNFAKSIGIGQNNLFKILRDTNKLITGGEKHNTPYQLYINQGYFKVAEKTYTKNGKTMTSFKTYLTGKGQVWIFKGLVKRGYEVQPFVGVE